MRKQLKRNKRKMYYALYDKQMPVGDDVLECKAGYKKPVAFRASLSTGQSNAQENPFGTSVDYDRIICSIVTVTAGVICHYIIKWLDGDK